MCENSTYTIIDFDKYYYHKHKGKDKNDRPYDQSGCE